MLQLRREHELLQKMFNYPAQCRVEDYLSPQSGDSGDNGDNVP
jgi:hypothetical protein